MQMCINSVLILYLCARVQVQYNIFYGFFFFFVTPFDNMYDIYAVKR